MATAQTHTDAKTGKSTAIAEQDAIKLLKADHDAVKTLFEEYEKTNGEKTKAKLSEEICLSLKVHMQIEEEIFYPEARDQLKDEEIVNEAVVEHAAAKDLIGEIEKMGVGDELYDAKVKVLSEQIDHHVKEEEDEMFPKLRKTDMDMKAIGVRLAERKQELMAKHARKAQ